MPRRATQGQHRNDGQASHRGANGGEIHTGILAILNPARRLALRRPGQSAPRLIRIKFRGDAEMRGRSIMGIHFGGGSTMADNGKWWY